MREKKDLDLSPLMTYPIEKITLSVILDTRREKSEGYYPVKYRITYLRKQYYYPCIDISPEDYSALHGDVRRKDLKDNKNLINAGFDNIKKIIQDLVRREIFSLEMLNKRLGKGVKEDVYKAFDIKVQKLIKAGKIPTSTWYGCAKVSIEKYAGSRLMFSDITRSWLEGYEKELLDQGKEYTTISINMRALRAIVNEAKHDGIISEGQYPFQVNNNEGYRIPESKGRKIALNADQILNVFNYPIHPDNEKYRDLFIFSFYCQGVNLGDILKFRYKNIEGEYISWYRGKTLSRDTEKGKIRALITPEMQDIIAKYGNKDKKPSNFIFPYLRDNLTPIQERMIIQNLNHTINKKMKAIGKALGYGNLTFYSSRHSWASISRRQGVATFAISKGLGHKSLSTTEIYLDSLSDDELIENAAKMPRR